MYRLRPDLAIVQSVDFFTPIVDDPREFGAIAAANSLSDVYAMGGRPITAMSVVCFPEDLLAPEILVQILQGGGEKIAESGAVLVGGHSVKDDELKYGLSVTGVVDPKDLRTNQAAKPGDVLILTKPLGTGLIANALKGGQFREDDPRVREAIESMKALNKAASEVFAAHGVRCATDITGFGLIGHAREVADGSGAGLRIRPRALPVFELGLELAQQPLAGGSKDNVETYARYVDREGGLPDPEVRLAYDAQTSGGLLGAVAAETVDAIVADLKAAGVLGAVIGDVTAEHPGRIALVS